MSDLEEPEATTTLLEKRGKPVLLVDVHNRPGASKQRRFTPVRSFTCHLSAIVTLFMDQFEDICHIIVH